MRLIFQRAVLPILLMASGVASLVYGLGYHRTAVVDQQEVEEKVTIPSQFGPPPGFPGGPPTAGGPEVGGMPPFAPPPIVQIVKRIERTTKEEPESRLVFEVSIGGLARLDTGELKRTYAGKAPSLCPS